ncbi:integrin alpha-PS4-like [Battus philenor]|uniref:integrin alpha-PS4-like n=1 Tax=Battus philenor TaxID=42288 RepID=UPI0035CEA25D
MLLSPIYSYYHEQSMKSIVSSLYGAMPNESFFGYSITYQPLTKSLLIGAPTAGFEGQVFEYDIKSKNISKVDINLGTEHNTTNAWLGANIKAVDMFFTTCAPRNVLKDGTIGRCFVKKNEDDKMQVLKPMTTTDRNKGVTAYGHTMDTLGWSIDITPHDKILIGGAGILSGRVTLYEDVNEVPQLILPPKTEDSRSKQYFFNFGYSIASGNFFSDDQNNVSFAISTPYGDSGIGQVLFYSENGTYIDRLLDSESRLGTLFGAVLCTVKLHGERSSLLIGAPTFVPEDSHDIDIGAVHIYTPSDKLLTLRRTIQGYGPGGRFGSAIVNLGDLDFDQRDDVAIAAPYENDGSGAVYIYTASNLLSDKLEVTYTQKIMPKEFRTFGLSLAALENYDENGCNGLAVGAPESNAVAVFSCFSSIDLNVYTNMPNFQNRGSSDKSKFSFETCLNASYSKYPDTITADLLVKIHLMHPTAKFNLSRKSDLIYTIPLTKSKNVYCNDIEVLTPLDKNIELYPIQITVNVQLKDDPRKSKSFNSQSVILSERSTLSTSNTVWLSGCNFTICVPDVSTKVISTITSPYIIGSSDTENIYMNVKNSGETAYNACVRVHLGSVRALYASECRRDEGTTLICEPGRMLRTNEFWNNITISLETKYLTNKDKKINIVVDTYNHCDNETDKKTEELTIDLIPDISNLILMSESIPGETINITYVGLETEISHLYTIINNGVTKWVDLEIQIFLDNEYAEIVNPVLIYMDNQNSMCNKISNAGETNGTIVSCPIAEIRRNQKTCIMVKLRVSPLPKDIFDNDKDFNVVTHFRLLQNGEIKSISANSTLVKLPEVQIPFWVYASVVIVTVLVLIILVIVLYECGCLRRKKKVLLRNLKKSVREQNIRRTIHLRESLRATNSNANEQNNLIDSEDNHKHCNKAKKDS